VVSELDEKTPLALREPVLLAHERGAREGRS